MSLKLKRSTPPEWLLEGLSPISLHLTKTITVDPAHINHFIGLIYDQQEQLCMQALPIARNDYIRMCQTLLLKRVQDVHVRCFNTRAANFVRIYCNLDVPKPLYDLMSAIGRGFDPADGCHYFMSPVTKPAANPPNWWNVDAAILEHYVQMTRRMNSLYQHVEFSSPNDTDSRALGVTRVRVMDNLSQVVSKTPTPTPAEGLLRMMCPDALLAGDVVPIDQCGFRLGDQQFSESFRLAYVGSAVLPSNLSI